MNTVSAGRQTSGNRRAYWLAAGVVGSSLAGLAWWWSATTPTNLAPPTRPTPAPPNILTDEVPSLLFKPLTEQQALTINAATPISLLANPAARPLSLATADSITSQRALDCMTTAIYFEAGFEGEPGRAAVAQVILNRVRHPAFPKTVCDVVFQGSERVTGCQFSFTCDGALLRVPNRLIWDESRRTAERALAGQVAASVGWATHYHADYVVPYWGPSLVKTAVIGAHIFYRMQPGMGSAANFVGVYAGAEPAIALMAGFSSELPVTIDSAAGGIAVKAMVEAAGPTILDAPEISFSERTAAPAVAAGPDTPPSPTSTPGTVTPGATTPDGFFPSERRQRRSRLPM